MANYDFDGTVKRFQTLAVRSTLGEEVKVELARLVAQVGKTVQAVAPAIWWEEVRQVRGQLRIILHSLEVPEPALPEKLTDPANLTQRAFYTDAIAQLSLLIESGR